MVTTGTFSSAASASLVEEVRDLHQEVRLGQPVILVYNMSMEKVGCQLLYNSLQNGHVDSRPSLREVKIATSL